MATLMNDVMGSLLPQLRIHPIHKWVRAAVDDTIVIDTRRAIVVWQPRRVVASYAVPVEDISGDLVPFVGGAGTEQPVRMGRDGPPVLDPSTPFTVHSCPGRPMTIRARQGFDLPGAAFAADDADLRGYVLVDWEAFTHWYEEDQLVLGHPHDPFDRIDCLVSSRHVVISAQDLVLADSTAGTFLFETPLPLRYYVPRSDVRMDVLEPTDHRSVCAYKGVASYWSATVGDVTLPNIAWTYEEPLADAAPVRGLVAFFTERLDLTLDGIDIERPITPWS